MTAMSASELQDFLARAFPQAATEIKVEAVGPMTGTVRLFRNERHLRPGGTISGPSMTLLADAGFYVALLAQIGEVPLAVTTNLALNFMRKPADTDLLCDVRIMKIGRTLAVGDCLLYSEGGTPDEPVAHATMTYAGCGAHCNRSCACEF